MEIQQASSSEKTLSLQKIMSLFSDECKLHIFAFSIAVLSLEAYVSYFDKGVEIKSASLLMIIGFFFFYCVLENLFKAFVSNHVAVIFSVLPSILLYGLLRDRLVLYAAVLWLFCTLVLRFELPRLALTFVLDAIALFLWFDDRLAEASSIFDMTFLLIQGLFHNRHASCEER